MEPQSQMGPPSSDDRRDEEKIKYLGAPLAYKSYDRGVFIEEIDVWAIFCHPTHRPKSNLRKRCNELLSGSVLPGLDVPSWLNIKDHNHTHTELASNASTSVWTRSTGLGKDSTLVTVRLLSETAPCRRASYEGPFQ